MADEQSRPPFDKQSVVPKSYSWPSLLAEDGDEFETHYRKVLESISHPLKRIDLDEFMECSQEITTDLEAALEQFATIAEDVRK